MVHIELFEKLFEVDLRSPNTTAKWWFHDGWVDHVLTNEEVLFNRDAKPFAERLARSRRDLRARRRRLVVRSRPRVVMHYSTEPGVVVCRARYAAASARRATSSFERIEET